MFRGFTFVRSDYFSILCYKKSRTRRLGNFHLVIPAQGRDDIAKGAAQRLSISLSQSAEDASLGIRQSARGESEIVPTFGPSGMQLRLNC